LLLLPSLVVMLQRGRSIVVTYAQLDSNIHVLYVLLFFFKNTAQNMQSGKGYAKNHLPSRKNYSLLDSTVVNNLVTFSPPKSTIQNRTLKTQ
jgi:hypothetical protein